MIIKAQKTSLVVPNYDGIGVQKGYKLKFPEFISAIRVNRQIDLALADRRR